MPSTLPVIAGKHSTVSNATGTPALEHIRAARDAARRRHPAGRTRTAAVDGLAAIGFVGAGAGTASAAVSTNPNAHSDVSATQPLRCPAGQHVTGAHCYADHGKASNGAGVGAAAVAALGVTWAVLFTW